MLMHSRPKEQREAVRNLVHSVLTRDMGTFNAERFKDWVKDIDARFRKVGLTLMFEIRSRTVHFTIREIRSRRTAFKFAASTHVPFDDRDVVMSVDDATGGPRIRAGGLHSSLEWIPRAARWPHDRRHLASARQGRGRGHSRLF